MKVILNICRRFKLFPSQSVGTTPVTPTDEWILDSGFWNDSGEWQDDDFWND